MAQSELITYKCPCCGGALAYHTGKQQVNCGSCGNDFTDEQLKSYGITIAEEKAGSTINWNSKSYKTSHTETISGKSFNCNSCGAEVVSDGSTAATECMYCGNPLVMRNQVSGMYKPDYVIPFKMDKKAAKEALKTFYKGKTLLPNSFKSDNRIEKITGLYVPFWLFNCKGSGKVTYDATKSRTWSDSSYRYTETSHYLVVRGGSLAFDKLSVDASSKMDDAYMDSIEPFNYVDMIPFTTTCLPGYFADKYDVDVEASSPRATERIKNSTERAFRDTVKGYDSVETRNTLVKMEEGDVRYAFLPVWMLNTMYNGKKYQFAMNGQTGKMVGELPIDKAKYWSWFFGVCSVSLAVLNLISFLLVK